MRIGATKELIEDNEAAVYAIVASHALLLLAREHIAAEAVAGLFIANLIPLRLTGLFCALTLGGHDECGAQGLAGRFAYRWLRIKDGIKDVLEKRKNLLIEICGQGNCQLT